MERTDVHSVYGQPTLSFEQIAKDHQSHFQPRQHHIWGMMDIRSFISVLHSQLKSIDL